MTSSSRTLEAVHTPLTRAPSLPRAQTPALRALGRFGGGFLEHLLGRFPARVRGCFPARVRGCFPAHFPARVRGRVRVAEPLFAFLRACAGGMLVLGFATAALLAQTLPAGVIERDTVVPGPIPLPATITLPVGKGPFPGVVLVHNGTADGDRDETIGEIRVFRDLAWGLAQRGIVVLRYEKRSRTEPSWFARAGFTVFDETVQDAVAAARLLRRQVELNPKRIYVAGHGLGGIVAPRIAQTEGALAGIIILAGATQVLLADQMEQQLNFKVTMAGADSFKVRYQLQPIRPILERIRELSPKDSFDIQPMRGLGGTSPKYWLDLNSPDPATVLRSLKLPVLALQGLRDFEMPPANFDGWIAAVGPRRNLTIKRYPTLTHTFTEGGAVSGPQDYAKPLTVNSQVIADIADWILRN